MFEWNTTVAKWSRVTLNGKDGMSFCDWRVRRQRQQGHSAQNEGCLERSRKSSPLAAAIERGDIGLVRGAYFEDCLRSGRPFEMRQSISPALFWDGPEALEMWQRHGKLFLLIVSYGWLSPSHPDPACFHLYRLARLLREFKRHVRRFGVGEVAVVVDFCSLWQSTGEDGQDGRTPTQIEQFHGGLEQFNLMYLHADITAIKLTSVPPTELRGYGDRGWTFFESIIVDSKAGMYNVLCWSNDTPDDALEGSEGSEGWAFLERLTPKPPRLLPLTPADFEAQLEERRQLASQRGVPLFTNGKDNKFVPRKYEETFRAIQAGECRSYFDAGLDDERVAELCKVLRDSAVRGLNLGVNRIGREGLRALFDMPSLRASLRTLLLMSNCIGEDCVELISDAIPRLRSLRKLTLETNPICELPKAREALLSAWTAAGKEPRGLLFFYIQ